jgi:hypothetical protein
VSKPAWRRLFDALEGRAAPPIEKGVRTDLFNDTITVIYRTRRGVQRRVERHTRRALHMANLPAASDLKRLSEQVAALHRDVRALERSVHIDKEQH